MRMNRTARLSGALCALLSAPSALADMELNMPRGVTPITNEVYDLHMLVFWICVGIGVVVFGAMFYSVFAHTKKKNPTPATFSHSTTAEVIWTTIPIIILVVMAVPAAKTLVKIEDSGNPDMTIKVTGYQWRWHYNYLEEGVEFFSALDAASNEARQLESGINPATVDNYLLDVDKAVVVPVDTKVRLLVTANDVIHAWWVPELSGKRDAIPGFVNEMWFKASETGVYRGQCAELCGYDHGFMPIVVKVVDEVDYVAWLGDQGVENPSRFARKINAGAEKNAGLTQDAAPAVTGQGDAR
ncbi:MAG: cytochrome c oxidase subunit II [Pseudomonadota bacterium]